MKRTFFLIILIIATFSTTYSQSKEQLNQRPHPVKIFFMSGINAFNAHNLDEFMKQFAEDVDMYTPTGWLRGKDAVRARFSETFQQFPSVKMEIEDLQIREIKNGTVLVDFKWRTYPRGTGSAFHGVGSGVYIKRKGKWVEVLEHETIVKIDEGIRIGNK
jgi:uncharacterized protein (TIGR02246 family)